MGTGLGAFVAAIALLVMAPALGAPKVVPLGADASNVADPAERCADLAGSPYEAGAAGVGAAEGADIFLEDALSACEAAHQAHPAEASTSARLGRIYLQLGRLDDASDLAERAAEDNVLAAYVLSRALSRRTSDDPKADPERADALLQQAADAGFAPALYDMAERYAGGWPEGELPDLERARDLYRQASDKGHPLSAYRLGWFHRQGWGGPQDFAAAMTQFDLAAARGEPLGDYGIGVLYEFGEGVEVDLSKSVDAFTRGAEQGEPMSETALAYYYDQGQGVTQDHARAHELLIDAEKQGNAFAAASLSLHYLSGQGVAADAGRALNYAAEAAAGKVAYANGILGYLYGEGLGTSRDLATALSYLQQGSDAGDSYSAQRLPVVQAEYDCAFAAGSPYENHEGSAPGVEFDALDADAAISACEKAVSLNPASVGDGVWLGRAYLKAGRASDAAPLLKAGAQAGNMLGQTLYAQMLVAGPEDNRTTALELYKAAAGAGFAPAEVALGKAYAEGGLVEVDLPAAIGWYQKALDHGMQSVSPAISELSRRLSVPQGIDLTDGFAEEGAKY